MNDRLEKALEDEIESDGVREAIRALVKFDEVIAMTEKGKYRDMKRAKEHLDIYVSTRDEKEYSDDD